MITASRRGFLGGLLAVMAAPAIVRPGILMPIKPSLVPPPRIVAGPMFVGGQFQVVGMTTIADINGVTHELELVERLRPAEEPAPSRRLGIDDILRSERETRRHVIPTVSIGGETIFRNGYVERSARVTITEEKYRELREPFMSGTIAVDLFGEDT